LVKKSFCKGGKILKWRINCLRPVWGTAEVSDITLFFAAMIAFLRGTFALKVPTVHMEVGGGYELQISLNTYSQIESLDKGLYLLTCISARRAHPYGFLTRLKRTFLSASQRIGCRVIDGRMMFPP